MNLPQSVDLGRLDGPLLVFGGPYSNLEATFALKLEAQRLGIPPQQVICTGDVVAYCADPEATVNMIRDWGIAVVQGNCETALAAAQDDCGCGFTPGSQCQLLSAQWYRYGLRHLSDSSRAWMGSLPPALVGCLNGRRMRFIHGGLWHNNQFLFSSRDQADMRHQCDASGSELIIAGHAGIPFGYQWSGSAWLNAGVIGMPANDGTRRGWYLLLEPFKQGLKARWNPLLYDAEEAARKMQKRGLPIAYAEALLTGLWPSHDPLPPAEIEASGNALQLETMLLCH